MKKNPLTSLSKALRRNATDAENVLWYWLKNRQINGVKFRRQQPIGSYIVDFISFEKKLVIEVDGGQHNQYPGNEKDEIRSGYLMRCGYRVLRFWNTEILTNLDGVIIRIQEELEKERHPHLTSPVEGEE